MSLWITKEIIRAFILDNLSDKMMSLIADAMITNRRLAELIGEEKFRMDLDLYNNNEMTPAQRLEFESRLIAEAGFFIEVNPHEEESSSTEELLLRGKMEKASRNYKNSQKQKNNTPKTHTIGMNIKYGLAAASITVMLIVAGGIGYNFQPSDPLKDRLYAEYYEPLNSKDISLLNNNFLVIAKQRYVEGDYANALLLLKSLPSTITIEVERNLYVGLTLMQIGEYEGAINYLEGIMANQSDRNFIPQVRWYLGLCYLKEGNNEKAIGIFRAIVDRSSFNYKQAKKILRKLRDNFLSYLNQDLPASPDPRSINKS